MTTLLDDLAERAGIEPGYHDIWGTYRATGEATKRLLLAAMGLPAEDDAACRESLARLAAAGCDAGLAATVVVAHEAQPGHVALRLPPVASDGLVAWRLRLEDGAVRDGAAAAASLPPAARGDDQVNTGTRP